MLSAGEMNRSIIKGEHLNGILQEFKIFPYLSLNLHTENQIRSIRTVAPTSRVLHIDSCGGLVKLDKRQTNYSPILNYIFYLKDLKMSEADGLPVQEVITNTHDTNSVGNMCHLLKSNHNLINKNKLIFRLIISDYSWPIINATLDHFNNESVLDYMNKVYKISTIKEINDYKCSWLGICSTRTLRRFTKELKQSALFETHKNGFELACFCFSLLSNTVDFDAALLLFKQICSLFLSESTSNSSGYLDFFKDLIEERPGNYEDVKSMIWEINHLNSSEADLNMNDYHEGFNDLEDSIKSQSPFALKFQEVIDQLNFNETTIDNEFYNPDFISFLQEKFLPFIFLCYSISDPD